MLVVGAWIDQNTVERYEDLSITSYRDMIDFLCFDFSDLLAVSANVVFQPMDKFKAVKISCKRDQNSMGISMYTSVMSRKITRFSVA